MNTVTSKRCPGCGALAPINTSKCSICGHTFRTTFNANGSATGPARTSTPPPSPPPSPVLQQSTSVQAAPVGVSTKWQSLATVGARLILTGGIIAAYYLLFFDTTVALPAQAAQELGYDRVYNIGLMNERTLGTCAGFGLGIVGALLMTAGQSRGEVIDWRWILWGSWFLPFRVTRK